MGGRRQHPLLIEGLLVGADAFVQGLLLILLEATVGDVQHTLAEKADRLIIELKVRAEQPQRCSLINKLQDLGLHFLGASGKHAQGDILTERRGSGEQLTTFFIKGGNLLADDLFQGSRQIALLQRLDHPLPAHQGNLLIHDELAQDFTEEQRVALGDVREVLLEIRRQTDLWEQPAKMDGDVGGSQRLQGDLFDPQFVLLDCEESFQRRHLVFGPGRRRPRKSAADEDRDLPTQDQHPEQHQRRLIGEVEIVKEQNQGTEPDQFGNEKHQRVEQALALGRFILVEPNVLHFLQLRQDMTQIRDLCRA